VIRNVGTVYLIEPGFETATMNVSDSRLIARLKVWCRMIANIEASGTSCKVVCEKSYRIVEPLVTGAGERGFVGDSVYAGLIRLAAPWYTSFTYIESWYGENADIPDRERA
jgi:hypothetical protein